MKHDHEDVKIIYKKKGLEEIPGCADCDIQRINEWISRNENDLINFVTVETI